MVESSNTSAESLQIIETNDEVIVVLGNDSADWIARYAKRGNINARFWAERMVQAFEGQKSEKTT